jgi:hypothetical protein
MLDATMAKSVASLIMEGAMKVSIADAKKHLSEFLRSVGQGEAIAIAQKGLVSLGSVTCSFEGFRPEGGKREQDYRSFTVAALSVVGWVVRFHAGRK